MLRVQLGGCLSYLALECLDILPGKLEEVENGLDHPTDTAAPSTWTWLGEEREMQGKYHHISQLLERQFRCYHNNVHYTGLLLVWKKQPYDEALCL